MVEIFLLEQLVTFAKCGTLSKAAEELHITQPALSRSMKKLEDAFGVSLFDREKSKIFLNETGKVAVQYAEKVLEADCEMVERTVAFDRSKRTIVVGSCAALPINTLMPLLQERFSGKVITTEISPDDNLINGLKKRIYQLAVLHEHPLDNNIFCQRYTDEQLYITLPLNHALASQETLTFADLEGMSILAHGSSGFWLDICKQNLKKTKLLIQDSIDMLHELLDSSSLPAFNSNRAMEYGYESSKRVTIPLTDEAAHTTYYLACLDSEKSKYNSIFNAVRSAIIRGK